MDAYVRASSIFFGFSLPAIANQMFAPNDRMACSVGQTSVAVITKSDCERMNDKKSLRGGRFPPPTKVHDFVLCFELLHS